MFGFGKAPKDPLVDAKSAERWLASFPGGDPLAVHAEVVAALGRAADRSTERSLPRLAALFHLDTCTKSLRRNLTAQYIEHANRSSKIENQLWQALFDLTQSFLVCYSGYAHEFAQHGQSSKWRAQLPEYIARQVAHLGHDAKIRLLRYEPWIPAKWAELHNLFTSACSQQVERRPLTLDPERDPTTIEHQYLIVLALHLLNPGNLTARQLAGIASELHDWCAPLRLTLETSPLACFYVDLASRSGLRRRGAQPLEGRVLYLDTRPLHQMLLEQHAMVEQKLQHDPMSSKSGRRFEQIGLYAKLAALADPEFRPFPRRGERAPASGEMEAIVGFARITGFLREEERSPVPEFEPGHSYGGTMELAVFGHMRNEDALRQQLVRRRFASFGAAGGAWEVKDVSHSGMRLIAPMDVATTITLGTLCALRASGQSAWALGVVRRMRRLTADRAEVGLQVIANSLIAVTLVEPSNRADEGYSVDGETGQDGGRRFTALFLALRRRDGDASVQSLIVPPAEFQPARRFRLETPKASHPIRFGSLLEQAPDWVWAAIEPIDLAVAGAVMPAPSG